MADSLLHQNGDLVNNRYKIIEPIGHGATGEVFTAKDSAHNDREIAIKYLKLLPGKSAALEQFKSEFATLTHLSHPHIAKVYDFEQDATNGQFFFTSELVAGMDFLTAVQDAPADQIEELFVQSLRALEYLHGNGIFHFDIKSANLLVADTPSGKHLKLIDFGLAAIRFQGKLAGTPSYMAPEMVRRENPDGRADLYSLGVLIYSAFAKTNPFRMQTMDDTFQRQLTYTPPPPSLKNPEMPQYLDGIIMRLLEKRANERFQTAGQAIRELNLRSPKKYTVETEETQTSYIPLESKFIGRVEETKKIQDLLANKGSGIFLLRGANGSGRSRFLAEIKHLAQVSEWTTAILTDSTRIGEWQKTVSDKSDQPLFIGVDDYHVFAKELWGAQIDETCALAVKRVLKPTILLLTLDEEGKIAESIAEKNPSTINLSNFTIEEIKQYLTAMTGLTNPPQSVVDLIFTNTGGNPFIVTEMVKSLVTNGILVDPQGRWKESTFEDIKIDLEKLQIPTSVEERLLSDFAGLPEDAKLLAYVMAVIARPVTVKEIADISEHKAAHGSLMMLLRRGFIKFNVAESTYYFKRPIIGRVIYNSIPESEQSDWHDKISKHIQITDEKSAEELLHHISRGKDPNAAKDALAKLIDIQFKKQNNHQAIENALFYLERWNDMKVLQTLARIYNRIGKYELAIKTVFEVHDIASYEIIGTSYLKQSQFDAARRYFTAALQMAGNLPNYQKIRLENLLAEVYYFEGKIQNAIEIYEKTKEQAASLSYDERIKILNNSLGPALFQKGEYTRAISQLESDLDLLNKLGDKRLIARTQYMLAESYRKNGENDRATAELMKLFALCKETDDLESLFHAYNSLGNIYNDQRKFKEAATSYEHALDVSSRLGEEEQSILCIANLGIVNCDIGDHKKAYEYFSSALAYLDGPRVKSGIMELYRCRVHLEMGDICRAMKKFDEAREHLEIALNLSKTPETEHFLFWIKLTQANLAKDSGEKKLANTLLAELKELADTEEKKRRLYGNAG